MSDKTPIPIPERINGLSAIHQSLQDNLIAQREQTIRKIAVLIDKLNRLPGAIPDNLIQRIATAYEEAADELAAIDPASPLDASSVYLITARLQALCLCVTSLVAAADVNRRAPASQGDRRAGDGARPTALSVGSPAAALPGRATAEITQLFPEGLRDWRLKQRVS